VQRARRRHLAPARRAGVICAGLAGAAAARTAARGQQQQQQQQPPPPPRQGRRAATGPDIPAPCVCVSTARLQVTA